MGQVLLAIRRFRTAKKGKRTAPRAFLAKSYLDEALLLYEILLEALEEDTEHLEWWYEQRDEFAKVKPASNGREPRAASDNGGGGQRAARSRRFRKRTSP